MNDFIKPNKVDVHSSNYIEKLINANLKKDLHDNEEVCEYCHGTGMVIASNSYGLFDDPEKQAGRFPYEHRALTFCPRCYNGVVHRCHLCGEIMERGMLRHNCEKQKDIDWINRCKKLQEEFDNAPIATKEIEEKYEYYYSDCYTEDNGYFNDWEDFFENWFYYHEENNDKRPEYVWVAEPVEMSIDAADIVENATEDLYEEASENISDKKVEELQDYLDNWCKTCGVGTTYYESHKYKIRIPWEDYNER